MNKISAVIIDDEFFNRKLIRMLIEKLNPAYTIEGEAENIREGFKLIDSVKPNVVFLDIKMPDGSGFDLLTQFDEIDFEVVFITGFDQYALQAFNFNALDYVLKPIDSDKFKLTLEKVETRIESKNAKATHLKQILESYRVDDSIIIKIPIHYNNKVELVNVDDIMYIQNDGAGVVLKTFDSGKHNVSKRLHDFEFILDSFPNFIKVNKDNYINVNFVSGYSKGNESSITMKDAQVIEVPEKTKEMLIKLLEIKR